MRILFLHPNFPAQFKQPALKFAGMGHDVAFLCQTHFNRKIRGVRRIRLKGKAGNQAQENQNLSQLAKSQLICDQYRQGMASLEKTGWLPDVVISHSGWGCGFHVKEIWPRCRHISYLEWWFDPESELLFHDLKNKELGIGPAQASKLWKRNQYQAVELACADKIIAPTIWQRDQLPTIFRNHCEVIYDGIDKKLFKPDLKQQSEEPLLTYGTRGMEPIRCFPEFVRELPNILLSVPNLRVEIAGNDEINYGGLPPSQGSWGKWANQILAPWVKAGRVKWLGRLTLENYVKWLQSSWCHVYLTQPYVASWSLTEALSCGCQLVASDVAPVREFCNPNTEWLVDSRQPGFLLQPVMEVLKAKKALKTPSVAKKANQGVQDLDVTIKFWEKACLAAYSDK